MSAWQRTPELVQRLLAIQQRAFTGRRYHTDITPEEILKMIEELIDCLLSEAPAGTVRR